jgi:hypothetical protein
MFSKLRSQVNTKLAAPDASECQISVSGVSSSSDSSRGNIPGRGQSPGYDHIKRGSLTVESNIIKIARRCNTITVTNDDSSDDDGNLNSKFHPAFPFTLGHDIETQIAKPLIEKGLRVIKRRAEWDDLPIETNLLLQFKEQRLDRENLL